MKRLKVLFAILLLLLAIPLWRLGDYLAIYIPFEPPFCGGISFWFAVFVAFPTKLIWEKLSPIYLILAVIAVFGLACVTSPLSRMATVNPDFNHCGAMTYTGSFYPLRSILSEAHQDDLEARNQQCWIRKIIMKAPRSFDTEIEVEQYMTLIQDRLLKPKRKYKASLPLISALYVRIYTSWGQIIGAKRVYDSLHFWKGQYTEEISLREYSIWSWPHSEYIKFEYGLIEANWEKLIESISLS